jgi:hydroxyacylglutathione hydrolase
VHVETVPCLTDNYSYLVGDDAGRTLVAIDPCDPVAVLRAIEASGRQLVAILNTHHHGDHVGGNLALREAFPDIPVYAHAGDRGRIPLQTHYLQDGEELEQAGLRFRVLFVPGHTRGHIAYLVEGAAFVGDSVFGAGCGRMFEGTPEIMHASLQKLAALPGDTLLYFAHEYTASNLRFASFVEPDNSDVRERVSTVARLREAGQFTTPSNVELERRTNPFFRVGEPQVRARFAAEAGAEAAPWVIFGLVRRAKDQFR